MIRHGGPGTACDGVDFGPTLDSVVNHFRAGEVRSAADEHRSKTKGQERGPQTMVLADASSGGGWLESGSSPATLSPREKRPEPGRESRP